VLAGLDRPDQGTKRRAKRGVAVTLDEGPGLPHLAMRGGWRSIFMSLSQKLAGCRGEEGVQKELNKESATFSSYKKSKKN